MSNATPANATCPNGHVSADPEWCDTCGAKLGAPAAGAPGPTAAVPPASTLDVSGGHIAPVSCPHCGAMNSADNLFCESCGYDFTTGQTPEPPAAPGPDPAAAAAAATITPADPSATASAAGTPGTTGTTGWTVVVEVDPAWFALKGELADRPLPSPSTSTVPLFGHVSLVGRTSQSRGLRPEIALDTDTAVSRRHAQLLVEDDKLSVVDLSSTNGTYVLDAGQVPTDDAVPLAAGVPAMLDDGDQVFVGAWSRLTVRRT